MNYYSAVMICVMLSLILLCVLVHENERLGKRDKAIYYLTYALIGVSALSEWISIFISGNIEINSIFLRIAKCCDYVFTPMSGVAIVMQMRSRNVITKILYGVIGFNTLFQLTSFFTGWMTVISSDNTYSHGPLYGLYMAMYLVIVFLVIIQWCNANDRTNYYRVGEFDLDHLPDESTYSHSCLPGQVLSIVCFEISPDYRGKGIAKQLLKQICSDAARNGYQYVEAYPEVSGQTSMAFTGPVKLYEKNGFAEFKNDGKTIIMRKHLTKS